MLVSDNVCVRGCIADYIKYAVSCVLRNSADVFQKSCQCGVNSAKLDGSQVLP